MPKVASLFNDSRIKINLTHYSLPKPSHLPSRHLFPFLSPTLARYGHSSSSPRARPISRTDCPNASRHGRRSPKARSHSRPVPSPTKGSARSRGEGKGHDAGGIREQAAGRGDSEPPAPGAGTTGSGSTSTGPAAAAAAAGPGSPHK